MVDLEKIARASLEAGIAEGLRQNRIDMKTDSTLTDRQIEAGWKATFSTNNPFCPCDLKSFTKAVRWAEVATQGAATPPAIREPRIHPGSPSWRSGFELLLGVPESAIREPEPIKFDTPQGFLDWFAQNYNGEVVFSDPAWHARSIFRTAVWHFRRLATPAPAPPAPSEPEMKLSALMELENHREWWTPEIVRWLQKHEAFSAYKAGLAPGAVEQPDGSGGLA